MSVKETNGRTASASGVVSPRQTLGDYRRVRAATEDLCSPLVTEDYIIQSMPEVSPAKWHLAHTTWFFETFLLLPALPGYEARDPAYAYLFNSYYNQIGEQFPRPRRGLLSRPTVSEVYHYREHIDRHMADLIQRAGAGEWERLRGIVEIGLHHEQQHQELMLTDIKHVFSVNPLHPVYRDVPPAEPVETSPLQWHAFEGGVHRIGHEGAGFAFDNERPRHQVYLEPFDLASRLVTNAEYLAFLEDGGYERPDLWLSDGWDEVRARGWEAPLYWTRKDGQWMEFTLSGLREIRGEEPVCHVSYYEADAFARWAGARLPTEAEWEVAAADARSEGNFVESGRFHPAPASPAAGEPVQMLGDVWEWTSSAYASYPGYQPPAGALGEYNAKFMSGRFVLRGGSCATPADHIRKTYRNFFSPEDRWQFQGIRLSRNGESR